MLVKYLQILRICGSWIYDKNLTIINSINNLLDDNNTIHHQLHVIIHLENDVGLFLGIENLFFDIIDSNYELLHFLFVFVRHRYMIQEEKTFNSSISFKTKHSSSYKVN